MKIGYFNVLCHRIWTDPITPHGDVVKLQLTPGSRVELVQEILGQGELFRRVSNLDYHTATANASVGAGINEVTNPITRSVVKIESADDTDRAVISFGDQREPVTITV